MNEDKKKLDTSELEKMEVEAGNLTEVTGGYEEYIKTKPKAHEGIVFKSDPKDELFIITPKQ